MDVYTLLYLKWITSKDLPYGSGNSAQYYVAVWLGGEFVGEWTMCMDGPSCSPETITALLTS